MTFDSRKARTDAAIKHAFLDILNRKRLVDMSVAEVARAARVSRSTIYARYANLSALYNALVKDMLKDAAVLKSAGSESELMRPTDESPKMPHAGKTSSCDEDDPASELLDTAVSFCEMLRSSSHYAPLVKEERFLPTLLEDSNNARTLIDSLMDHGYDFQQAYTVAIFQMGGVFAVGTMVGCTDRDWPKLRTVTKELVSATLETTAKRPS